VVTSAQTEHTATKNDCQNETNEFCCQRSALNRKRVIRQQHGNQKTKRADRLSTIASVDVSKPAINLRSKTGNLTGGGRDQ
jgi:hypothetical protein